MWAGAVRLGRSEAYGSLLLMETNGRPRIAAVDFQRRDGEPRLDDLWFLLGSRCNLACIHCYVGSSPTNDTLPPMTLGEVRRFLDEGARYGLAHVYLTGGEPFLNKEILPILEAALADGRRVTVLTNATRPLEKAFDAAAALARRCDGRLSFRVSLDHYVEARHDAIRGRGQFRITVDLATRLARAGLRPIVTTTAEVFRGNPLTPAQCEARYRELFAAHGADVEVKILPAVLEMGSQLARIDAPAETPALTDEHLAAIRLDKRTLMCANGRSVLKRADGALRVYPCPIIYEVPAFDLGASLAESFDRAVSLSHPACATYCCRAAGTRGTCTNG